MKIKKGTYTFEVHKAADDLLRVKCMQSRHSNAKNYHVYVEYSNTAVTGTYCTCGAGARTIGMCAHAASIVWYLSYAHNKGLSLSGSKLEKVIFDAAGLEYDSDEDE